MARPTDEDYAYAQRALDYFNGDGSIRESFVAELFAKYREDAYEQGLVDAHRNAEAESR